MRSSIASIVGFALLALASGCELLAYADRDQIQGAGGQGGAIVGGDCVLPIDCGGAETACRRWACIAGRCELATLAEGTPTATQMAGDCLRAVCNAAAEEVLVADDLDRPVDGKGCTDDLCVGGAPQNPPSAAGVACAEGGGKVCDGAERCVGCLSAADCAGQLCVEGSCLPLSCANQQKDGSESDVDCGGAECQRCVDGKTCGGPGDCQSGICTAGLCQVPSCTDAILNGPGDRRGLRRRLPLALRAWQGLRGERGLPRGIVRVGDLRADL
jgi:hypothetical protein